MFVYGYLLMTEQELGAALASNSSESGSQGTESGSQGRYFKPFFLLFLFLFYKLTIYNFAGGWISAGRREEREEDDEDDDDDDDDD